MAIKNNLYFRVALKLLYTIDLEAHPDVEDEDGEVTIFFKDEDDVLQISTYGDMFGIPRWNVERQLDKLPLTKYEKESAIQYLEDNTSCDNEDYFIIHYDDIFQCTGVKDVNGNYIYEGDYIKIPDNWEEFGMAAGEVYEIYFNYGGFRLKPKHNKDARGCWLEDNDTYSVVGNVIEGKLNE